DAVVAVADIAVAVDAGADAVVLDHVAGDGGAFHVDSVATKVADVEAGDAVAVLHYREAVNAAGTTVVDGDAVDAHRVAGNAGALPAGAEGVAVDVDSGVRTDVGVADAVVGAAGREGDRGAGRGADDVELDLDGADVAGPVGLLDGRSQRTYAVARGRFADAVKREVGAVAAVVYREHRVHGCPRARHMA